MEVKYGKDQKKVRYSVQNSGLSGDRGRDGQGDRYLQGSSAPTTNCGGLAEEQEGRSSDVRTNTEGEGPRAAEREAQGQGWRTGDDGVDILKKMEIWKNRQKNVNSSIIISSNLDQFQKPAKS